MEKIVCLNPWQRSKIGRPGFAVVLVSLEHDRAQMNQGKKSAMHSFNA